MVFCPGFHYNGAMSSENTHAYKVAVGCDHGAYDLKDELVCHLKGQGHTVLDMGCQSSDSCDYPDYVHAVCRAVQAGEAWFGIVMCTTGIGASITANKHPGIRAALCNCCQIAYLSRSHNDANVLALSGRQIAYLDARAIADVFLSTHFSGVDRHVRRIGKIEEDLGEWNPERKA
jgi:ribose 5-phosphate isomerase B